MIKTITTLYLTDIANAIRNLLHTTTRYTPLEMADAINSITINYGIIPEGTYDIKSNGLYDIRQYRYVNVNTPKATKTQKIYYNGTYLVSEYKEITVKVQTGEDLPDGEIMFF